MKKLVDDSDDVMGKYDDRSRDDVIALMDYALAKLTPEQRETAKFGLEEYGYPYDDSTYYAFRIKFKRLETDAEEKKREEQEAQQERRRAEFEAAEYERLKKKFGK